MKTAEDDPTEEGRTTARTKSEEAAAEDILRQLNEAEASLAAPKDTLRGMRRFVDGVLDLWRSGSKDEISAVELKALLAEIRDASDDPKYWEEVMQAVPCEAGFGLSLSEVAEAVCVWLTDVVREDDEDEEEEEEEDDPEAVSELASYRGAHNGSNSPRYSLKTELRQAEKAGFNSASPPTSPQAPYSSQNYRRRSSLGDLRSPSALHRDSLGVGPSSEILRAQELMELMRRAVDASGDVPSQRAMQKLNLAHDGIARQLQQQETELMTLRRDRDTMQKRLKDVEEELGHVHELQHEVAEKTCQLDEFSRKASAMEAEVEELQHHLADCQQEVQKLRSEVEQLEQKNAEAKKRDWQLRDRIESLEETEASAEGQLKWLRSELDTRSDELSKANHQISLTTAEKEKMTAHLKEVSKALQSSKEELSKAKKEASPRLEPVAPTAETLDVAAHAEELARLREDLAASVANEERLRSQLQMAESAGKRASMALAQHHLAEDDQRQELEALRVRLAAAEGREAELRTQLEGTGREAEHATQSKTEALQQELDAAISREGEIRSKFHAAEKELHDLAQRARGAEEGHEKQLARVREELAASRSREEELRGQMATTSADAPSGQRVASLEEKVQLQQDQLKQLRAARDSILAAQQDLFGALEDEDLSPRQMMQDRHCRFLSAQLRILLNHSQEMEQLLDSQQVAEHGESRRRQSLQRVHEEGKRVFDELSEKLYTLEVQKADVDEEVGRLQVQVAELEAQVVAARRQRDELRASTSASTGRPSSAGFELGVPVGLVRASKAFTATSATSDTRSRASLESPTGGQLLGTANSSSSDPGAFFGGTRSTSELRSSPKTHLVQGVVKVLSPNSFMVNDGGHEPKLAKQKERHKVQRQGQRRLLQREGESGARSSTLNLRRGVDDLAEEEGTWRRRPSHYVRASQSVEPGQGRKEERSGSIAITKHAVAERHKSKEKEGLPQRMREMRRPDAACDTQ